MGSNQQRQQVKLPAVLPFTVIYHQIWREAFETDLPLLLITARATMTTTDYNDHKHNNHRHNNSSKKQQQSQ